MSDAGGHDRAQEMARELSQCVTRALDDSVPSRSMDDARRLAQTSLLQGLDRLLGVLAPYASDRWPGPLRPVIERIQRAAVECAAHGSLDGFRRLDDELGLMARAIERVPLARLAASVASRPDANAASSASVPLADALEGIPGERGDGDLMRRVHLRTPVAGALRAALDWLVGGSPARMRMSLASDGSALDVICEGIAYNGIQPAADVLASVGGHLGPAGDRPGAWTVRVPIRAERETFLMLEQDELQLAVPWHAVVRVRLIPADTIEMMLKRQPLPVLPPLAVSSRRMAEQPVAVVALGLKRACLVADRLVWRMSAVPTDAPDAPPADGIRRAVRTDDGEVHWVLEPDFLLRNVVAPSMGQSAPGGARPPAAPTAPAPAAPRSPLPFPEPAPAPLAELTGDRIEPLAPEPHAEPAPAGPVTTPESAPAAPAAPAAPRAAAPRRALVAEDSIAARIYLVRLLEQQGYLVHGVATDAELRAAMAEGPWTLVCADSGLAEAPGASPMTDHLRAAGAAGATLVALVRDGEDERRARDAGVTAILRKPFERAAFDRLLARLAQAPATGDGNDERDDDPDPREWGAR